MDRKVKCPIKGVLSFSWNPYHKHGGRSTLKERKNWQAYDFADQYAESIVYSFADTEQERRGESGYGPYEMSQIGTYMFLLGRLYGRTERSIEKNKIIKKLKAKIKKLSQK